MTSLLLGERRLLGAIFSGSCVDQLRQHRAQYAEPPSLSGRSMPKLIDAVVASGLLGRGGASFPTGTKMQAVAAQGRERVVVVNGAEGEPASKKDLFLLTRSPNLIIDGVLWASAAVGAKKAIVCVNDSSAARALTDALAARNEHQVNVDIVPNRFVVGEESALVHWINNRDPRPTIRPPKTYERGVDAKPTLVDNVETVACIAQIANFGPDWFRRSGVTTQPGTALVTVDGAVRNRGIYEVAYGTRLTSILSMADVEDTQALLIGGYFGVWLTVDHASAATFANESLGEFGASTGAGVIYALPKQACGLKETARVLSWMAIQSAGQCGPCVNGLGSIADLTRRVYTGNVNDSAVAWLERWANQIEGRGACRLPDGTTRFMKSALAVFADDIAAHQLGSPCNGAHENPVLPLPTMGEQHG